MKILQIYDLGPTDDGILTGGLEAHILNISKGLVNLGCQVTWLTGAVPGCKERVMVEGVEIVRIDIAGLTSAFWDRHNLKFGRQLFFLLSGMIKAPLLDLEFDVVHGHVYSSGLLALYLSKIFGKPCVNTIHGTYYHVWERIAGRFKGKLFRLGERIIVPFLARLSDVQVHAESMFPKLIRSWGVSEEKLKIILNAVDTNRFRPCKKPDTKGRFIVVTARRLVKKNGVDLLLQAMPKVIREIDAELLVVGDGPEKLRLESLAYRLGISERVKFVGWVPNSMIPYYLALADVVVIPSIAEASSISMLEAMAMGKPLVASNLPGITDVAEDGYDAILVPPFNPSKIAEAILEIARNKELALKIGRNARKTAEKYCLERIVKKYYTLYKNLLKDKDRTL